MDHTPFQYGGLHFIPEQCFESTGPYHSKIPLSRMRKDTTLNLCGPHPGKFAYSHDGFYAASTVKDCDIFRCAENGRLYVPCGDDLYLYEEQADPERGREHER